MCGPKSCTKFLAWQLSTLPEGGTFDKSETFRGGKWVLYLPIFKFSALCGRHGLYTRPEAEAGVTDVVLGHGGPLHLHLGLHGDKVYVGGGTSSGLDIAPSTIIQKPVVWPWWGAPCPKAEIWARKGAIHSITQFLSDFANIFRSFWPFMEAILAIESRNFDHRKVWYPSTTPESFTCVTGSTTSWGW